MLQSGPGRLEIAEHYRFAEENPAVSRVLFRIVVNFRVLPVPDGAGGMHDAPVSYLRCEGTVQAKEGPA
jgi:hypothetical protein